MIWSPSPTVTSKKSVDGNMPILLVPGGAILLIILSGFTSTSLPLSSKVLTLPIYNALPIWVDVFHLALIVSTSWA